MRVYLQLAFGFAFLLILVTALAAAPKQPIPPRKWMYRALGRPEKKRPFLPVDVSGAPKPYLSG